jgi:hypothetical protein
MELFLQAHLNYYPMADGSLVSTTTLSMTKVMPIPISSHCYLLQREKARMRGFI